VPYKHDALPSLRVLSAGRWGAGVQIASTESTVKAFLAMDEEGARAAAASVDAARAAGQKLGLLAVHTPHTHTPPSCRALPARCAWPCVHSAAALLPATAL